MKTIMQVLESKGQRVWTISPNDSVHDAVKLMADKNIGALVITVKDQIVGIFSERDFTRKVYLIERSLKEIKIEELMTQDVAYVNYEQGLEECMTIMTEKKFRHLPVLKDNKMVGVISIGDIVKNIISEQNFVIKQYESYIRGEYSTV